MTAPLASPRAVAPIAAGVARLGALGIVFGDLATSPLYTLQTVVAAIGGRPVPAAVLGVLSLIVWTLIVTVSVKYCLFVMRADNRGEGGILALMSLIGANTFAPGVRVLTVMGLVGAALVYGDGVITPAISVLSALEGVNTATHVLQPFVMPMAVAILCALFALQHFGTESIGRAFGPVMLLWCIVIAGLGVAGVVRHPIVLCAVDPRHAVRFLSHAGGTGPLVLGGVFLCITGGEALYADMGHFGRGPIRWSWFSVVLPAVLLSYAGQAGSLLDGVDKTGNPFFAIAPHWAVYPLVGLATVATIIASQSIITGSFSMTRQAMQLGWLPDIRIRQTSDRAYGQIYVPAVNWAMMVATIGITVVFASSQRLAGAYGTAVATTMLLTTGLLYTAMRRVWHWPALLAMAVGGLLLIVDGGFFVANLFKIADGGWLPLSLAAMLFVVMITWRSGVDAIRDSLARAPQTAERLLEDLAVGRIARVEGTTVFLSRGVRQVPQLVLDFVHFARVLPRRVITVSVVFEDTPRVEERERSTVEVVTDGFWHVVCRFGFVEVPHLRAALARAEGLEASVALDQAIFVGARELVVHRPGSTVLRRWRLLLFAFLCRNAVKTVERFNLPAHNVVEIAREIAI